MIENRLHYDRAVRMLEGCKNRICVTDDLEELKGLRDAALYYIAEMYEYRKGCIGNENKTS